jgi:hypothetical protein
MYALDVIVSMNNRAAAGAKSAANSHLTRESSYCLTRLGVVIHSASLRSTVFIDRIKHPKEVGLFVRRWKACRSTKARNRVADSYF